MTFLLGLILKLGVPQKYAKAAEIAALVVFGVLMLWGAKALYDHSIIKAHDAKIEAATAKADRKADDKAAVERRADDARAVTETQEVKDAINEAKAAGADPRAAYYNCVKLQQAARRERKPPPEC